jgi:YD repeat-containing protein
VATTTYLYDNADKVTSIATKDTNNNSLASFSYSYDAAGRVTSETDNGVFSTPFCLTDSHRSSRGTPS